jgi:AAA ATPase domain
MRLIQGVTIRNFRSIETLHFTAGHLTAFIGTNGSGKSNIFRGLNLFFNGVIEGLDRGEFSRDFHKPWRSTKNRFMEVDVEFHLPSAFAIRSEMRAPLSDLGLTQGGAFTLRKHWTRDQVREEFLNELVSIRRGNEEEFVSLSTDEARTVSRFLQLIKFRYVPNHVHPSEMLQAERGALQQELLRTLRRVLKRSAEQEVDFDALLSVMSAAAKDVVGPVTAVLQASPGHVSALELATPGDWAEVVWSLALKLQGADTHALDVGLHGSGTQTFLMYVLTHFLDTRFSQEFGWHQATIWAIEEPESFLHADLENQLSAFLVDASAAQRFQTLLTTHELLFAAAADERFEIELANEATTAQARDVLDLANHTLAAGVTPFVHPLNLTAPKPTLLVDGPYDVLYLTEAYRLAARSNPWDIRSLEQLDPNIASSGKEQTRKYLRQNQGPLRARPTASPVIVLLDWEDSENDRQTLADVLAVHPTSTATVWPVDRTNPELDESFTGIERYLATDLVETAAETAPDAGIMRAVAGGRRFALTPQTKSAAKQALAKQFREREQAADVQRIIGALSWIESHLPAAETPASLPGT